MASFTARVGKSGKVIWSNPVAATRYFEAIAGKQIQITINEPNRSQDQNRMIHSLFRSISSRTGYTPRQVKDYLKSMYIAEGDRGTSDLGIEECSEFCEFVMAWAAAELGVVL